MTTAVFGTKEWADTTADVFLGCENNCRYCYARAEAARFGRRDPDCWDAPVLQDSRLERAEKLKPCKIMFPAHSDITEQTAGKSLEAIDRLLRAGHTLLIVSKPTPGLISRLCDLFKDHKDSITFRFTIGAFDNSALLFWEPKAPILAERLDALKYAYIAGYETSISCEPMLDRNVRAVIAGVREYVTGTIWLGLPNSLVSRLTLNKQRDDIILAGRELLKDLDDDYIRALYEEFKGDKMIRWKDSIKKILGLERPTEAGLDI